MRWHRAQGSAIKDDNGVVVALQGTSQDITEGKLAHEALRERERQLAEAQRAARLGWWEHDVASGRVTMSDEMCRLWRVPAGHQESSEEFVASVHPEDRPSLLEAIARLDETAEPICVELRAAVADGHQSWFRVGAHVVRDEEGRPVKHFGTAQDVTEQKQAEQDQQTAKALYQRIIETTHEGILILTRRTSSSSSIPGWRRCSATRLKR